MPSEAVHNRKVKELGLVVVAVVADIVEVAHKMVEEPVVDKKALLVEELVVDTLALMVEEPVVDTLALLVVELVGMKLVPVVVVADNIHPFVVVRPFVRGILVVVVKFHLEAGKDHVEEKQDQLEYLA